MLSLWEGQLEENRLRGKDIGYLTKTDGELED